MSQRSERCHSVKVAESTTSHIKPHHRRRTQELFAHRRRKLTPSMLMFLSLFAVINLGSIVAAHQLRPPNLEARRVAKRHTSDELATNHHEEPLALGLANEQQQVARGKRTLYACEEKQLEIECQLGESIQLIRANYGRFSIQICNEHGQLDWKVNCMSPDSFDIITRSCQAKQSCQLLASNGIFGDACPGTQKYLEVHYQCVPSGSLSSGSNSSSSSSNRTFSDQPLKANGNAVRLPIMPASRPAASTSGNNVIRPPDEWATGTNSETEAQTAPAAAAAPALPDWMRSAGLGASSQAGAPALVTPLGTTPEPMPSVSRGAAPLVCRPTERRGIYFRATPAGQEARAACPAHSVARNETATLLCRHDGQWAARAQASRCQSAWLHDLTQLLDSGGDSQLSILSRLAQRTETGIRTIELQSNPAQYKEEAFSPNLFANDLILIGRIISRLVERLVELLNSISDDKQRAAHARDIVQALVEVINNLSNSLNLDAWRDLSWTSGERQRVAGQLVAGLESACVLLAGALQQQQQQQTLEQEPEKGQLDFYKWTPSVSVAIKSFPLSELSRARLAAGAGSQRLQVTFPSAAGLLGAHWTNSDERFVLHLQASLADSEPETTVATSASEQPPLELKVVFIELRSLGLQMEPRELRSSTPEQQHLSVDSNLVSFSMVADARRALKVDLSAPIELVFSRARKPAPAAGQLCAHWDAQKSDWLRDACKLAAVNETHSACSCNQLTTFAMLANVEHDSQSAGSDLRPSIGVKTRGRIEELFEGTLLARDQTTRTLLHLSCVLAALLLALLLVAAAYNRAHARRLLGSMPSEPPPSLLVASSQPQFPANQLDLSQHPFSLGQQQQPAARNPLVSSGQQQSLESAASPSQPTSYSSDLANSDLSSGQSNNLILHKSSNLDQLAGSNANQALYSLMGAAVHDASQPPRRTKCHQLEQVQSMALVPAHVIGKLLALQLFVLLLVETETMLRQNGRAAREAFSPDNSPMMRSLGESAPDQPQHQQELDPVGLPTWLALFGLYYLASALLFWLLAQLVLLNGLLWQRLGENGRRLGATSTVSSYQPIQTISALYQGNRYGQCQMHSQHTGSSASLSNFSSSPATLEQQQQQQQRLYATNQRQQQLFAANGQKAAAAAPLEPLYGVRAAKSPYASQMRCSSGERQWQRCASKLATSRPLNWTLAQAGPVALAALLLWLARERALAINWDLSRSAHTSQLAYWPLLLNWPAWAPLTLLHLYCLPSICLALGILALVLLRRHMRQAAYGARHEQRALDAATKAADGQYESARAIQLALETKNARCACLTLLGLLVLNSVCWLAFFVHCQQTIEQLIGRALPEPTSGNTLVATFAASNLLIAALICCSQRRTLRRAAQLAGWTRLLLPARAMQTAAVIKSTPSPSSSHSSELEAANVYYSNQAQQQQHYGKLNGIQQQQPAGSKLSNSPSQHSLFVISRSRPQVAYGQHYGHEQALMLQQQQQHLYQQLALSQQHLYDSASNLQQQPMGGGPYNLQQQQQQQHMTLRPQHQQQLFARGPHDPFAMCPSGGAHAKTLSAASGSLALARHHQQTGEADGPLVALAGSTSVQQQQRPHQPTPTTTFGPNTSQMSASYQQQQQTTELRPSNGALEANQRLMMMNRAMATNMGAQALTMGAGAKTQHQQTNSDNKKQNQYFLHEHADEQRQQHFRRANSATRQQPSRSFASGAMMIDAPQLIPVGQPAPMQQHKRPARPHSSGSSADETSNIYDVANCLS